MWAAVCQGEEAAVEPKDADRPAGEVDEPALALGGRLGQRQAGLARSRRRHG